MREHQRFLPFGRVRGDRFAQCDRLEPATCPRDLTQVCSTHASDDIAALLAPFDQAIGDQPVQRLAQRCGAGGVTLGQRLDSELAAGCRSPASKSARSWSNKLVARVAVPLTRLRRRDPAASGVRMVVCRNGGEPDKPRTVRRGARGETRQQPSSALGTDGEPRPSTGIGNLTSC